MSKETTVRAIGNSAGTTRPMAMGCGVLLALAGCGAADESPRVIESDSAGVRIVESTRPAWSDAEGWRLSAAPILEIGSVAGGEADELDRVRDVDRLADGRLVVTSLGTHELRIYSPEGDFLGSIGREGEGPGEFMFPNRTWVVGSGDSLYVRAFQRLAVFDGTGAFARSIALPRSSPSDRFADGTYLHVVIPPGVDRVEPGYLHPVNALVRAEADGAAADTLAKVPGTEMYRLASAGGVASFLSPFGAVRVAAASGNSVVTAGGVAFEAWVLDETGRLVTIMRRSTEPAAVTDADVAALERRMLASAPPRVHPDRRRLFSDWTYPEYRAAVDELRIDAEGHIWLRAFVVDPSGPAEWSVFDPSGPWLGQVETPPGLDIKEIGADYVVGVWTDDLGVEYVRLYSLDKG